MNPLLRHILGTGWRLVTAPWRQHDIPIESATSIFGCSFGPDGWHPIVETLKERSADPGIDWRATTLYRYHKRFRPRGIGDLVGLESCRLPVFVYPWGSFNLGLERPKDVWASRFCGPSEDSFIEEEYGRIVTLAEHMQTTGYRPWKFGNGFIGGTFLLSSDGTRRFVVMQGNHRMSILAHMGAKKVAVRTYPGLLLREVRQRDARRWPFVVDGTCDMSEAVAIFLMFFEQSGHHVKQLTMKESTL